MRWLALTVVLASPAAAQEFYGQAELSFGQSDMVGAPVALQGTDGTLAVGRSDLSFGARFATGLYVQGDLGLGVTNNSERAPNTYNGSQSIVLHAGRDAGRFGYGVFVGAVQSDHDTDASDDAMRMIAGLEGGLDLGPRWSIDGHLGYMSGTSGSDSVATVTDGLIAGIGVGYDVSKRVRLSTSLGYINGQMDAPSTVVEAWQFELRAQYALRAVEGLSLFGAVQYGEYHQKENVGSDDITDITSVMAGLTYRFGKEKRSKTAKLSYLEPFLANTGGVLE